MHDFKDFGLSMMPYGTDPETGYEMYLLKLQRFAVVLPKCEGCGETNVLSAPLGKGPSGAQICYGCNNKLHNFRVQCGRLGECSSEKALENYKARLDEYLEAQRDGRWVPPNLQKCVDKMNAVAPSIHARADKQRDIAAQIKHKRYNKDYYCNYCGRKQMVRKMTELSDRHICEVCDDRRHRYSALIKRCNKLTEEECLELNSILDDYAIMLKRECHTPEVFMARRKLAKRMEELANE